MNEIETARSFSEAKLADMRAALHEVIPEPDNQHVAIATVGSFARREASRASDLDFYTIIDDDANAANTSRGDTSWTASISSALSPHVALPPAKDGAFDTIVSTNEILKNIGGSSETNHEFTRRMLLLLEGEGLYNDQKIKEIRTKILRHYISDKMKHHQITLFLLNDIIRYYRTICVDFEHKTSALSNKPWGLRNIKLVFSRKLLYSSGLFSVAMTVDRESHRKIEILEDLFNMTALNRIQHICGTHRCERVLESYNLFLEKIKDDNIREKLNEVTSDDRSDPLFRELKNEGHNLSRELMKLFEITFDTTHPIRRAIIF